MKIPGEKTFLTPPVPSIQKINETKNDKVYIGKTDRNLGTRIKEYWGLDIDSPIFNHFAECTLYYYTLTLHISPCDGDETLTNQDIVEHIRTAVTNNARIIDKAENWTELCFLKSLNITSNKLIILYTGNRFALSTKFMHRWCYLEELEHMFVKSINVPNVPIVSNVSM